MSWSTKGWEGQGIGTQTYERSLEPDGRLVPEAKASPNGEPVEVDAEFRGQGYYIPAYLGGLPENCYPEEGEIEVTDVEIVEVRLQGDPLSENAYDAKSFSLTDEEEREAEEVLEQSIKNGDLL